MSGVPPAHMDEPARIKKRVGPGGKNQAENELGNQAILFGLIWLQSVERRVGMVVFPESLPREIHSGFEYMSGHPEYGCVTDGGDCGQMPA